MNKHKDLPPGSQQWANELDEAMKEIKRLTDVVRRLSENAGLDMANPRRGINPAGDTPSIKGPVGQKLSSLADVGTYDVADGQVLTWSQQGQKWLPVTLPSAGGAIEIPMSYAAGYNRPTFGYGNLEHQDVKQWGYFGTNWSYDKIFTELWGTGTVYIGAGNFSDGPVALIEMTQDGFGRPYVQISASDYADGTSGYLTVGSYFIRMDVPAFQNPRTATAARPDYSAEPADDIGAQTYDTDLKKPVWWDGVGNWRDALGTVI